MCPRPVRTLFLRLCYKTCTRMLLKKHGFALIAIISLSLGVGANTLVAPIKSPSQTLSLAQDL